MKTRTQQGFTLIELLIAAAVFTYVVSSISGLFVTAVNVQRRATGIQRIEENAQFALESIAREVRVSTVTSGDTVCSPVVDPVATAELVIDHPINGIVTYRYDRSSGSGMLYRNDQPITSDNVDITSFAFCVSGSGRDGHQTRVTIPATLQASAGPSTRVSVSLQTTVTSRDLSTDLQ
jgi:prepilin-type N-terminal cleavage/methylation domain-containing protein